MKTDTTTRITPHLDRLSKMLSILIIIQSFERRIALNEKSIKKCEEGSFKLLPTYTERLRKSYSEAIATFKERIEEEEVEYNKLLSETVHLTPEITITLPEMPEHRTIEYDDDIESRHHQNTCGGH